MTPSLTLMKVCGQADSLCQTGSQKRSDSPQKELAPALQATHHAAGHLAREGCKALQDVCGQGSCVMTQQPGYLERGAV